MYSKEERYQLSLKAYRDNQNAMDYMLKKGLEKGMKQGVLQGAYRKAIEIARRLKGKGVNLAVITETTGLSEEQITQL